ncbi:hypothetical protein EMIT047CA2_50226 [Pseudomonas soli]
MELAVEWSISLTLVVLPAGIATCVAGVILLPSRTYDGQPAEVGNGLSSGLLGYLQIYTQPHASGLR